MMEVITNACSQAVLLTIHIYGIAAFWNFDIFHEEDASIDTVIFNISIKSIPEDTEPGYDFDDKEMRKLKIWPRGIVPYYIDTVSYGKAFRDKLRLFLENVNRLSGLQFVELYKPPPDDGTRWVLFVNRQGLLRTDGHTTDDFTTKGVQAVVLGYESLSNGDLFEFVLAVAGIPPQNNDPNRDYYIKIMEQNILDDKKHLFEMVKFSQWLFHDLGKYDFTSAGHFDFHKYSKNGMATIHPLAGMPDIQGRGKGFSYYDLLKLRRMYNFIARKESMPEKNMCQKMFKPGPKFANFSVQATPSALRPREKHYFYRPWNSNEDETTVHDDVTKTESKSQEESKTPLSWKKKEKPRWVKG